MFDVVATLCLLAAGEVCAERVVPVGRETCAAARAAASPRLDTWREDHSVTGVACSASPSAPLAVEEVAPGIHVHAGAIAEPGQQNAGDVSNLAIVIGERGVAVIDTGGSRVVGERIVATVRSLTDLPIEAAILTHMHPDHVFGATALQDAGAEIVGHEGLPRALAARADSYETAFARLLGPAFVGTRTPLPDRTVAGRETIDLGGRTLRLVALPAAHSPTDLTVIDTLTGTLFAGDLVFDRHTPALDGSLRGWQAVLAELDAAPPDRVVPGHGAAALSWPDALAPMQRYLGTLARDTRAAIDVGLTLSDSVATAAASEAQHWALFTAYNPRNATAAYTELEWE